MYNSSTLPRCLVSHVSGGWAAHCAACHVAGVGMDAPIFTLVALDACDILHIGRGKTFK